MVLPDALTLLKKYQAAVWEGEAGPGTSKKIGCFDAVVESFHSILKWDVLLGNVFHTRQEGRDQVFESLEVF